MTNPLQFHKRAALPPHRLHRRMRAALLARRPGEATVIRMIAPAISGAAFMGALARSPRTIGACVPSSKMLSRMMAAEVPLPVDGVVVELGGGTGRITFALLERGVPPEQLVVVEQSPSLADLLRKRFPKVQVIQGDAAFCYSQIPGSPRVHAVVSGLPLLSLPRVAVENIISQISSMLAADAPLIQFTYRLNGRGPLHAAFDSLHFRTILFNIPPARVEVFRLRESR